MRPSRFASRFALFAPALAWTYLLAGRGRFWEAVALLPPGGKEPRRWPRVAVIVPARDEATLLPGTLPSLLAQDYPGHASVVVVDDQSSDGTAGLARTLSAGRKSSLDLAVVQGKSPAAGWAGKTWAMAQGVEHVMAAQEPPEWLLFTDADIAHSPGTLRRLVTSALGGSGASDASGASGGSGGSGGSRGSGGSGAGKAAVSLMARLSTASRWERLAMPAFVYFFAQIYPFGWVNNTARGTAAAAGGCLLVQAEALQEAGGLAAVAGATIDDVALAKALSAAGFDIWLTLAGDGSPDQAPAVESLRSYPRLKDIWEMVARNAYTQLGHNPWLLAGTVLGMSSIYLAPPLLSVAGLAARMPTVALAGLSAWTAMTASYLPIAKYYKVTSATALALPFTAALYMAITLDSARRHRGGTPSWKGRTPPAR